MKGKLPSSRSAASPLRITRPTTQAVRGAFRDNAVLLVVLIPFIGLGLVLGAFTPAPIASRLTPRMLLPAAIWSVQLSLLAVLGSIGWFAVLRLRWLLTRPLREQGGRERRFLEAWEAYAFRPSWTRFLRVLLCLLVLGVFFQVFVAIKGSIPVLVPFAWDDRFMRLDQWVHLGHHPWEILHPLFGHPSMTRSLDFIYYAWFGVNLALILVVGWAEDGSFRRHFFLAYGLTWILLGNVAALIFSSAGPCYFDLATGTLGPYADLMAYLQTVDQAYGLTAIEVQALLLEGYRTDEMHLVEGIAAMPSIHVAVPFLFAIAFAGINRWGAMFFSIFGILTLIGSVHLGWHYAVDGYASILGVFLIWHLAGWLVARIPFLERN
jgi:hypothetical protein